MLREALKATAPLSHILNFLAKHTLFNYCLFVTSCMNPS